MSDKLTELAEQAGLHGDAFIDNPEILDFAMLIVRHCMDMAIDQCPGDTYELMQEFDAKFGVLNET